MPTLAAAISSARNDAPPAGNSAPRTPAPAIGIDLGGTKIEGVLLDAAGSELARHRIPAPRDSYDATLAAVAGLVATLQSNAGCAAAAMGTDATQATVGIGMPGSISRASGLVQNANSVWLNGRPFDRDLAARLGRAVRIANDANCFALSEAVDGAGAGARTVFGVILGTGIGGGIIVDGRILDGPRATGGEWGHNPLPWPNADELAPPRCWCGRPGCIEAWASGPGLAADHARVTGDRLTAEQIVALAGGDDAAALEPASATMRAAARATLDRHASRLARALAAVVNVIDPDVVVLGGGLSQLAHLYDELPRRMAAHIFSDNTAIRIAPPRWGDAGGVRGAAWLWR